MDWKTRNYYAGTSVPADLPVGDVVKMLLHAALAVAFEKGAPDWREVVASEVGRRAKGNVLLARAAVEEFNRFLPHGGEHSKKAAQCALHQAVEAVRAGRTKWVQN